MSFFTESITLRLTAHQKQWLQAHANAYPDLWDTEADVVRSAIQHFMICERGVSRSIQHKVGEKNGKMDI